MADFAPDNGVARVSIVGRRAAFKMVRSAKMEGTSCIPHASADVTIHSLGGVETMDVSLRALPPRTDFNLFVTQLPNAPFGLSTCQGDIETDHYGRGQQRFVGRFSRKSFKVAPGSGVTPSVHHQAFPDAQLNPATAPDTNSIWGYGSTHRPMPSSLGALAT